MSSAKYTVDPGVSKRDQAVLSVAPRARGNGLNGP